MEVEITVRVRAIVPDGLHLPRLAVDKNLDIPLTYLVGWPPPDGSMHSVGIEPKILTVQHGIREHAPENMWKPLDDVFTSSSNDDVAGPDDGTNAS